MADRPEQISDYSSEGSLVENCRMMKYSLIDQQKSPR